MQRRSNKHECGVTTTRDAYTTGVLERQTTWWHKMTSMTLGKNGWTPIFASRFWYCVVRWNILFFLHFFALLVSLWGCNGRLFISRIICFGTSLSYLVFIHVLFQYQSKMHTRSPYYKHRRLSPCLERDGYYTIQFSK
jgi:hypothetical protein